MKRIKELQASGVYTIIIQGQLDDSWLEWFASDREVAIHASANDQIHTTTITNIVTDQAGIVGCLRWLHGLGLVVLSMSLAGEKD